MAFIIGRCEVILMTKLFCIIAYGFKWFVRLLKALDVICHFLFITSMLFWLSLTVRLDNMLEFNITIIKWYTRYINDDLSSI